MSRTQRRAAALFWVACEALGASASAGAAPASASESKPAPASAASAASVAPASGPWSLSPAEAGALRQALQVLRVKTPSWDAPRGTAQRYERSAPAAPFRAVGPPLMVWVGRSGLAVRSDAAAAVGGAGPRKQEGDGRSPAGVLTLGSLWGYAEHPPVGVRLAYKTAGERDRCVDDADSPYYNQLTVQPAAGLPAWRSAESLRLPTDHYKYLIVLDYNTKVPQPGAGSCIFLHVAPPPGAPTAGCTALAEADLLTVLRWLEPSRRPVLLQLPAPLLEPGGDGPIPAELRR